MNVTLTPEAKKFIDAQIASGRFLSPDQVLEEAVARMMGNDVAIEELDEETAAAINGGIAEIERGEGMDFSTFKNELFRRIGRA